MAAAWRGCNSEGADMTDVGWKKKKGAGGDAKVFGIRYTKDGDTIH